MFRGKFTVIKNEITACDYKYVLQSVERYIRNKKYLLVSPIASQTLSLSFKDNYLNSVLNKFDLLVPDSQWVKRSLSFLYGIRLRERVYGPNLMLKICRLSEKKGYRIFLYGTTNSTLHKLSNRLKKLYPKIIISGTEASKYRKLSNLEMLKLKKLINKSQTNILFIGLGSPLQEIFAVDLVYKSSFRLSPITIVTVGAAFDFISGNKKQAPLWMQNLGFEWFFRLISEPARLWKRYIILGTIFPILILWQKITTQFYLQYNHQKQSRG